MRYTVLQTAKQNLDIKKDSNFVVGKIHPEIMMKMLLGKIATGFLKLFNLEIPHDQIDT